MNTYIHTYIYRQIDLDTHSQKQVTVNGINGKEESETPSKLASLTNSDIYSISETSHVPLLFTKTLFPVHKYPIVANTSSLQLSWKDFLTFSQIHCLIS